MAEPAEIARDVWLMSAPPRRLGTFDKDFRGDVFFTADDGSRACIARGFVTVLEASWRPWMERSAALAEGRGDG